MWILVLHKKIMTICREGTDNNLKIGLSAGFGVFMGIIPLWGFQMLIAAICAHFMRLNKPIVLIFSNISIPVMIPLILFLSLQVGSVALHQEWMSLKIQNINWTVCQNLLTQYLVGSIILAIISGLLCFLFCWLLLSYIRKS